MRLRKLLRSADRPAVPADLRERLVDAIPEDLGSDTEARPWRRRIKRTAYLAVAAAVLIAALQIGSGFMSRRMGVPAEFAIVSAAVAEVVRNLESPGAFYLELDQRTRGQEPFDFIDPDRAFKRIKIWMERPTPRHKKGRMRTEKEERKVVFDGERTLFHNIQFGEAKFFNGGRIDPKIADPAEWLRRHLPIVKAKVKLDTTVTAFGDQIATLTLEQEGVELSGGFEPHFYDQFDRRTVISWQTESNLLADLERYVMHEGEEILVAKLREISYRSHLDDGVFSHELPPGTQLMQVADVNSDRYGDLEPVEVARALFSAWRDRDWETVGAFVSSQFVISWMQQNPLARFTITGPKFRSDPRYKGWQVPYELVLEDGHVRTHALTLAWRENLKRWVWNGGI